MLKALRTGRKPANPNHIIFFSDEKFYQSGSKDKQPEQQLPMFGP
jgi:hypothetical protein